jgi:8-oxo-dGTP diphosphatase
MDPSVPVPNSAPAHIVFCPKCGTRLEDRVVGDKIRRACPDCDYIHFTDPKVGVGVLVLQQNKILLVKRAMRPEQGKWSIPAGFLDYGEDPRVTASREVLEETNLQVQIEGLLDVYFNPLALKQGGASIFILFKARLVSGELEAGDDALEAGFFGPNELPELAFTSTQDAIRLWQQQGSDGDTDRDP